MRNPRFPLQLWCIVTSVLGIVLVVCDLIMMGYLADAYQSVPASLGDDVTPFTRVILAIGVVLAVGGAAFLVVASRRETSAVAEVPRH